MKHINQTIQDIETEIKDQNGFIFIGRIAQHIENNKLINHSEIKEVLNYFSVCTKQRSFIYSVCLKEN